MRKCGCLETDLVKYSYLSKGNEAVRAAVRTENSSEVNIFRVISVAEIIIIRRKLYSTTLVIAHE